MITVTVTNEDGSSIIYDVMADDASKVKRQISRIMGQIITRETLVTR